MSVNYTQVFQRGLKEYPARDDDTMGAIRFTTSGVKSHDLLSETSRIEPRKVIHPACPYCRELYKEYEKYPGCCSSCHAPPTDATDCLADIWRNSPVPGDVYLYFKEGKDSIKRYYGGIDWGI